MSLSRRAALTGLGASLVTAACARGQDSAGPDIGAALSEGWTAGAALPIRVQEIYPAALSGAIYLAGGLSPDVGTGRIGVSDRVFSLEPGAAQWRERARLPLPIHHPNLVALEDDIYAVGGFTGANGGIWTMSAGVLVYSPRRNRWTRGPQMPAPYAETVAAAIDDRLHVVTGRRPGGQTNADWSDHADTNAHIVLDGASGNWTTAAPAPTARNSAAGAVLDGRLHVVGGRTVTGGNTPAHEVYDPATDRWETAAPLPQPEAGPRGAGGLAASALNGRLYAFGGEWFDSSGGGVYDQVWSYDPGADAWTQAGVMPTPRHGLGALELNGSIHTIGGAARAGGNQTSAAVEVFTP